MHGRFIHPGTRSDNQHIFDRASRFFNLNSFEKCRKLYLSLLELDPDNPRALHGLGVVSHRLGNSEEALRFISDAVYNSPNYLIAIASLGMVYTETGRIKESLECFHRILSVDPGFAEIHSNLLMNMQYLEFCDREFFLNEACRWAALHGSSSIPNVFLNNVSKQVDSIVNVGFVSADLRRHPVGYIILPLFSFYDRKCFRFFCYSNQEKDDELTGQIREHVDSWHNIYGLDDEVVAKIIRSDDIDILIDLSGHTSGNRLKLFSMKPAPIQVSWLGYFDTTGLGAIDYVLTDKYVVPGHEQKWFTEQLAWLPDSRFCYAPPDYAPEVTPPPSRNNNYITFGSFNNVAKLTEQVITCLK